MLEEYDIVRLTKPVEGEQGKALRLGDEGVIVYCYDKNAGVFEVEFMDEEGYTKTLLMLTKDYLEKVA